MWGTCAGMILLAEEVVGGRIAEAGEGEGEGDKAEGWEGLGGVEVRVVRNQFGRQVSRLAESRIAAACGLSLTADVGRVAVLRLLDCLSQAESFQHPLALPFLTDPFPAIFIRAPVIHSLLASPTGTTSTPPLQVLAGLPAERVPKQLPGQAEIGPDADAVMVRQGGLVISSFHPELTGDGRVHEWWVREVVGAALS